MLSKAGSRQPSPRCHQAHFRAIPLPEFRGRVDALYRAAGKAPKTRQQLDHALRLAESAGATTTADLTTETVAELVLARGEGANPNTTRGLLGRLKRACALAVKQKLLDEPPDWSALWPRGKPARREVHTAGEVAALLAELDGRARDWPGRRLRALGWLVALTGLRRQEALCARREDLDLSRGFVFVRGSERLRPKTEASSAPVPLPDSLVPVLASWLPETEPGDWLFPGMRREGPWVGGSPGLRPIDRLRQAGAAAGIPRVGFHSLRHSLATHMLRTGVPLWVIQRTLRHTTPLTTAHYLHPTDHDVAAHVRGLSYAAAG